MIHFKFSGWFCLLLGFLFSCKAEKEVDIAPTPLFYPVSVTRSASYTTDTTRSEFSYNLANQIIEEKQFKNGQLEKVITYAYNAEGKLIRKKYYNAQNQLQERDSISYQPAQQTFRLDHGYYDATGKFSPHHTRLHQTDAAGKVVKWQDFEPSGRLLNIRTYQYETPLFIRSAFYDGQNQHFNTSEITLDTRNTVFQNTQINLVPYSGNEQKHEVRSPGSQLLSAYTQTISFNDAGYPVKIVQVHQDGIVKTETYTYLQK